MNRVAQLWTVVFALMLAGAPALAADKPKSGATTKPQSEAKAPPAKVAVFRMHGEIGEAPDAVDFGFEMESRRNLHDLLERFRKVKKDESVKAVVLTFDEPAIGLAQLQEIRTALTDLRAAEKDVYCYIEEVGMGVYALASAATKIVIVPAGGLNLIGIHVESPYFKGLLDKIGVEADIEHMGAYKGAGEPFMRTGPSDEAKEMLDWLIDDIFAQVVETIALGRGMTAEEVRAVVDKGPFTAKEALAAKLVDELAYAEDFAAGLRKRYGENTEFVHNYGAKRGPELDFSNVFSLFKSFGEMMSKSHKTSRASIGVMYVDGMIVTGKTEEGLFGNSGTAGSTTLRRAIAKARDDDSIKAVVLRVDSPGGSALASDIIWQATAQLKKKKPLIISMGNVAASGGYYVSAAGAKIFADPGTITGSIGVVGGKLVTKGLWDWVGVNFYEKKLGKNADLYSTSRRFTDDERALVRKYMQEVYGDFTDRVVQGRSGKLKQDIDQLAGGRVYTGRQALANGLVDKLGGLQDAVKYAAAEANVSDYEIRLLPEPRNFVDVLMESLAGDQNDKDKQDIEIAAPSLRWTKQVPEIARMLAALEKADPQRAGTVLRALLRIELLGRERVLTVLPTDLLMR